MPIYAKYITTPAKTQNEETIEIEGYALTNVSILFPPGCLGLVGVTVNYGIKQIAPFNEGEQLRGNGETIQFGEFWILPEERTKLTIVVNNEDDTYPHTIYVRLVVRKKEELLYMQLTNAFIAALKAVFGFVG